MAKKEMEMLIVGSKAKAALKEYDVNVASDALRPEVSGRGRARVESGVPSGRDTSWD